MNEGLDKQLAVDRAVKIFSDLDIDGDGDITEVRNVILGLPIVFLYLLIESLHQFRTPALFLDLNFDF